MVTDVVELSRKMVMAAGAPLYSETKEPAGLDKTEFATDGLDQYKLQRLLEMAQSTISRQEARIAQLETLSTSDELTGLQNRRGFFQSFTAEISRCDRGMSPGGVMVLIDLDNFKSINDTYGHAAGDACLRLVGRALKDEIRAMDTAARLGGDEFVLLLSGAAKKLSVTHMQKMAWHLNHLVLLWQGEEIEIRASIGIKEYGAGDTADAIFNEADLAMYADKRDRLARENSEEAAIHAMR